MRRSVWVVVVALALSAAAWPMLALAAPQPARELRELSFGLRITPGLVEWFNQTAGPEDYAGTTSKDTSLLDQITAGRRMVLFVSAAEAEQMVPSLIGKIDVISYDLEHWPATPADEQADPVAAIRRFRALADQYKLRLGVGPDRRFALEYGAQLAPYVDQFALQVQRLQGDPETLKSFALPLIEQLRAANPDIEIIAQLRTEGGVDTLVQLADMLKADIDGIGILYSPPTIDVAKQLVARLRSGVPPATPQAPTPETAPQATAVAATPQTIGVPTPAPAASVPPAPQLPPSQCALPAGVMTIGLVTFTVRRRRLDGAGREIRPAQERPERGRFA